KEGQGKPGQPPVPGRSGLIQVRSCPPALRTDKPQLLAPDQVKPSGHETETNDQDEGKRGKQSALSHQQNQDQKNRALPGAAKSSRGDEAENGLYGRAQQQHADWPTQQKEADSQVHSAHALPAGEQGSAGALILKE